MKYLAKVTENFCRAYGITDEGNFEGKNIPNLIETNPLKKYKDEI